MAEMPHNAYQLRSFVVPGSSASANTIETTDICPGDARICKLRFRNPVDRSRYATAAWQLVPRLLTLLDRNPFSPTFGCFDRQYWHYRTAAFPSAMYQEGVLPLALLYLHNFPDNRWFRQGLLVDWIRAVLRFAAKTDHKDGSCDDYYPFERALGAAVFSLQAAARACLLLEIKDQEILDWVRCRAAWIAEHGETGRLSNHHALAALGLWAVAQLTGEKRFVQAAEKRLQLLLEWQNPEGWFPEYDGADPGYQTVTIDCLAKLRRLAGLSDLDDPIQKAVQFAALFLHPDGSFGGHYGSRGTQHFYPHGMELLAGQNRSAAILADGFLQGLRNNTIAALDDERMFIHRLSNLIEAYIDWSPYMPVDFSAPEAEVQQLPQAGIVVRRQNNVCTIISAARGGVFKHFSPNGQVTNDCGLVVELEDGRIVTNQFHRLPAEFSVDGRAGGSQTVIQLDRMLTQCRFDRPDPVRQALFYLGMVTIGRFARNLVRRLLQRRLIHSGKEVPIRFHRQLRLTRPGHYQPYSLHVEDTIELLDKNLRVKRMAYAADFEAAYVAATNVYQPSLIRPWHDLSEFVEQLNRKRQARIERRFQ